MAELHLLHLDPGGLTDHLPAGPAISFPPSAEGRRAFAAHLRTHHRARFKLLVDLPDEQFTIETIPPLRGSDRRRLISRRRQQTQLTSPFITTLPLGHQPDEPPGESLLFATLSRPEALQTWLDVIRAEGCFLAGIHSAAFVGMALPPHLGALPAPAALVAWRTPAGLRVSYYTDGKLRFSRLTPASTQVLEQCPQEIQRTRQYLIAQRLLSRDTPLRIVVLAPAAQHAALQADGISPSFECIDSDSIAAKLGAPTPNSTDSLPLLLQLLARRTRLPAIDAPALRKHANRHRLHQFGLLGAMALAGACAVLGVTNLIQLQAVEAESAALQLRTTQAQARLDARLAAIPATPLPPTLIHTHYAHIRTLLGATTFDTALHQVAHALDRFPDIELTRLEWSLPPDDAQPHPTLRLHLALPTAAPPSVSERFLQTLRETAHAEVTADRSTINPPGGNSETSTSALVVRLDFAPTTP